MAGGRTQVFFIEWRSYVFLPRWAIATGVVQSSTDEASSSLLCWAWLVGCIRSLVGQVQQPLRLGEGEGGGNRGRRQEEREEDNAHSLAQCPRCLHM